MSRSAGEKLSRSRARSLFKQMDTLLVAGCLQEKSFWVGVSQGTLLVVRDHWPLASEHFQRQT